MRLKLIACEVMYRELCHVVASSPNTVDAQFVPKGLHDIGAAPMSERIQALVDTVDAARYEAVLLGYALCNNGLAGLTARDVPLVLPRGHDCITLFMGSRARYARYFHENPGVYFETTGWSERGRDAGELTQLSIQRRTGMDSTYEELARKYGEDNARYLYETLCDTTRNYRQYTYIAMGVGPEAQIEARVRQEAAERGWKFERMEGDLSLIRRLVDGPWDARDFLVVPPGSRIAASYGEEIVAAEENGT
ncbi:MAG: DUF1638 domain-containing protein [Chthonomonadales bacterium]|nr:DUF1638 domain-containing protein [Chthonomonadales bacterium]